MTRDQIAKLRAGMKLTQNQFGQLVGAHPMTVSKWERGEASPTSYQLGLMMEFDKAVQRRKGDFGDPLEGLLVTIGIVGVLLLLLNAAKGK